MSDRMNDSDRSSSGGCGCLSIVIVVAVAAGLLAWAGFGFDAKDATLAGLTAGASLCLAPSMLCIGFALFVALIVLVIFLYQWHENY